MRIHDGLTTSRQSFGKIRKQKRSRAQKWRVYYFIKRILLYSMRSRPPTAVFSCSKSQSPANMNIHYVFILSRRVFFIFIVRCAAANNRMKQFCRMWMWGCEKYIRARPTKLYSNFCSIECLCIF